ncbi:WG repeat-containing protein [Myxococcota bacterium]|nr:WG repeat-containing protein [Myxococcota bacterium]
MDWRTTKVANDSTHHVNAEGSPIYAMRFHEVLKFHAPGLAPARDETGAFHIDTSGDPAYSPRFLRTFGFYEGLAAVTTAVGWCHIDPHGRALSDERYDWCGNFQSGRAVVRLMSARYCYVNHAGERTVGSTFRYAGDYRDGVAVVQGDDGRHTHIDLYGEQLHGVWFEDLDVFHKSYARARDRRGWMHVTIRGVPLYARRFAAVEPFYNGQARVEREDGGLEVINEAGHTLVELRPARRSVLDALSADLVGFWRTKTLAAAVASGLPDALPGTLSELSGRVNIPAERLQRLLMALAELDVTRLVERRWSLTPRGSFLRSDHPMSLAGAALEYDGPLAKAWELLPTLLRDPDVRPPDPFAMTANEPDRVERHHQMLRSYARHDYAGVPTLMALRGDERVLDAGGGLGVLAELLIQRYPEVQVTVMDRPEVIAQLQGSTLHLPQVRGVVGELFAPWPRPFDAVVVARVLHDWPDSDALEILRRAREVLDVGAKLYILDIVCEPEHPGGSLCDLHLLCVTGGQERDLPALQALLTKAGFSLIEAHALGVAPSLVVAEAR